MLTQDFILGYFRLLPPGGPELIELNRKGALTRASEHLELSGLAALTRRSELAS
jgi:hypothetical protein